MPAAERIHFVGSARIDSTQGNARKPYAKAESEKWKYSNIHQDTAYKLPPKT